MSTAHVAGFITKPKSKVTRLFQEAKVRGGTLCSPATLAEKLKIRSMGHFSELFGSSADANGSRPTAAIIGDLVRAFNEQGVPLRIEWLYLPLDEFESRLNAARDGAPDIAFWHQIVWRHARAHPSLTYELPEQRRLRRPGAPPSPRPSRLRIGDQVRVAFDPPNEIASGTDHLHLVLIAESGGLPECLFPLQPRATAIPRTKLLAPEPHCDPFEVEGPVGDQHVYALLTRFEPGTPVHANLADADLRLALDVLASELTARPPTEWALYRATIEVVAS